MVEDADRVLGYHFGRGAHRDAEWGATYVGACAGERLRLARRASPTRAGKSTLPGRNAIRATSCGSYAERLGRVELNTTGYRLRTRSVPALGGADPPGFRFAVKMPHPNRVAAFTERVRALGDRLGPVRIVVQQARDDAVWRGCRLARPRARVGVRLPPRVLGRGRDRPRGGSQRVEGDAASVTCASASRRNRPGSYASGERLTPLLEEGKRLYAYFKHEDEPLAPQYAGRLRELLSER